MSAVPTDDGDKAIANDVQLPSHIDKKIPPRDVQQALSEDVRKVEYHTVQKALPEDVPQMEPHMVQENDENMFHQRYSLGKRLGKGSKGTVYKGTRLEDNMPVPIKVIPEDKVNNWQYVDEIKTPLEIAILRKLQSIPGVIKLYDSFNYNGEYKIVMQTFSKCMDLFDYIMSRDITEQDAKPIFKRIVQIALLCYRAGIAHNDIKAKNIIVDLETLAVYLIDFGTARYLTPDRIQRACGTNIFYPPELITSRSGHQEAVNVWNIGCVLYVMLFSQIPFKDEREILTADLVMKKEVTPDCKAILQLCLARNPSERPSLKTLLTHAWVKNDA